MEGNPETILLELGGCGRFQILLSVLGHLMKVVVSWSMATMMFSMATPDWWCVDDLDLENVTLSELGNSNTSRQRACTIDNGTRCSSFIFNMDKTTMVSEFSLVCDYAWVPATTASIQMAGMMTGNLLSGAMADSFGRKRPLYLSIAILCVGNIVGAFSVSSVMFTAVRFFIGLGTGFFLTIQYSFFCEFTLAKWRSWQINFPSWPLQNCLYALVAWRLKNWKHLQLATGLLAIPFLGSWWFVPESFRWYISHDRTKEAEEVVRFIGKINNRPVPDLTGLTSTGQQTAVSRTQEMTVIDLFRTRHLAKITCLSISNWLALGLVGYGTELAIPTLSGNLYLNIFLFSALSCPAGLISIFLQNSFGRTRTTRLCFGIITIAAFIAGGVQYITTGLRDSLTTGFTIVCYVTLNAAMGPVQTTTVEIYPTQIRNVGNGFLHIFARLGSMVGPQLIFLSFAVPGLNYLVCGALSAVCVLATLGLPETKASNLEDKLKKQGQYKDEQDKIV